VPDLCDVLGVLDQWFDPATAEPWDAVGLVCGDPAEAVRKVLLAVDAVPATVEEAIRSGSQLLITHHPLLLGAVHGVPASDPKGALVHRMIRAGIAHHVIHTNADVAEPGVSDSLATRLGLDDLRPLEALTAPALDKLVVYVPTESASSLIDALAAAGAGRLGDYDRCAWSSTGRGTFRAGAGAHPAIGAVGEITVVDEARVEMVVPRQLRSTVLAAMRAAHPYEEPAFDLLSMAELPDRRGHGRFGVLAQPMSLREFVAYAGARLPQTSAGVRAAGSPDRSVRTVAVCGGAGSSLLAAARAAGADVYLTADLKHHQVIEAVTERGDAISAMAVVDAAHWATEQPWLHDLAPRLRERFGTTVEVAVSTQVTDPWSLHAPSQSSGPNPT
jgi:dinuclear metal center YbgI/SA1388 family protein